VRKYQGGEGRIGVVIGAAATSLGGSSYSFFTETLPVVQWFSVLIGIVAGVLAIVLAVKKLQGKAKDEG
jgi:hypothetical protein